MKKYIISRLSEPYREIRITLKTGKEIIVNEVSDAFEDDDNLILLKTNCQFDDSYTEHLITLDNVVDIHAFIH